MVNTYTWKIDALCCSPQKNGRTNVVVTVHWRLNGTDGQHNGSVYGAVNLPYDTNTPFTPYADLTHAQVIDWVQKTFEPGQVASLEASVAAQIEAQNSFPDVTLPPPWAA